MQHNLLQHRVWKRCAAWPSNNTKRLLSPYCRVHPRGRVPPLLALGRPRRTGEGRPSRGGGGRGAVQAVPGNPRTTHILTENSFIVRPRGDPPEWPCILNTRITVEQIANYFRDGWGVTEIVRDLGLLTRYEIEAAIQYYLNHRVEIEADRQRSRELYEAYAPQ